MTTSKLLILLALTLSCGKIEQVQDSFVALSGNNDLKMVELRIGAVYRNDPAAQPQGYDFIEFENTQYRIGAMDPNVATAMSTIPRGQLTQVYFKGQFAKRSGLSSTHPSVEFDVIDLESISKKD